MSSVALKNPLYNKFQVHTSIWQICINGNVGLWWKDKSPQLNIVSAPGAPPRFSINTLSMLCEETNAWGSILYNMGWNDFEDVLPDLVNRYTVRSSWIQHYYGDIISQHRDRWDGLLENFVVVDQEMHKFTTGTKYNGAIWYVMEKTMFPLWIVIITFLAVFPLVPGGDFVPLVIKANTVQFTVFLIVTVLGVLVQAIIVLRKALSIKERYASARYRYLRGYLQLLLYCTVVIETHYFHTPSSKIVALQHLIKT